MSKENTAYGRISPQAPQLEAAVLGAVMLEPQALQTVMEVIKTPETFYSDANQRIFSAIERMYNRTSRIDFMTVCEELKKTSELELVGGSFYVTNLTRDIGGAENILNHARVVAEKYILREIIRISQTASSDAFDDGADPFDLLNDISSKLIELETAKSGTGMIHALEAAHEAIEDMASRADSDSELIGDSYGFVALDSLTGGACAPNLTIIAADTSVGKSVLALNFAQKFAFDNIPTAFFSLEMSPKQLIYRAFAGELNKSVKEVKLGKLTDSEKNQLERFMSLLGTKNLYFNSKTGIDVIEARTIIRGLVKKQGVKKVVVDYLQLMSGGNRRFGTKELELSFIAVQLKQCALELGIQIIALSQVTIEKGFSRLFTERDLRGSSAIGQHADDIFFIIRPYRQKMVGFEVDGNSVFTDKDAFLQLAKCREGEIGIVPLDFSGIAQKFTDSKGYVEPLQVEPKNNFRDNQADNPF